MVLFAIPVVAAGQGMGGGGMGGMGGGRHGGGRRSSGDSASSRPDPAAVQAAMERHGFAALLLDHRAALQLTDSQVVALTGIQSEFQAQTATTSSQLDSLRAANKLTVQQVTVNHDTLTASQRDTVVRRRDLIAEDLARIRDLQQQSKQRAIALLTSVQQQQATTLEQQAEQGVGNNGRSGSGKHGGQRHG